MIGNEGYKSKTFKCRLSYKVPKITMFDVVEEIKENRKNKHKENKNIGKEPGE